MASSPKHDLFLSYHSPDQPTVRRVQRLLEIRGISTFLDRDQLIAGLPWPQALEEALNSVRSVAVFLGRDGLSLWMKREIGLALDRQVHEERAGRVFPVIPVLLPGADPTPGFLFTNTWVDLRTNPEKAEGIEALVRALHETTRPAVPVREDVPFCPYRGLQVFREEHAAIFFGRETFCDTLAQKVQDRNLIALIGPSGSGKSSIVQAGLIPKLRRCLPPSPTWDTVVFTPGDKPYHRLGLGLMPFLEPQLKERQQLIEGHALGADLESGSIRLEELVAQIINKSKGTERLLVVADQFEEIFTLTPEKTRKPWVDSLLNAIDHSPVTVVLCLRGDFYGSTIGLSRALSDRLEGGIVNVGPMTRDELLKTIIEPARRVGLAFDEGLPEIILKDVEDEPGALPLLEFALTELWAKREHGLLTREAYKALGEVSGSITQRAEAEFCKFSVSQQKLVRRIFTRLVRVPGSDEPGEDTKRRVSLKELGRESLPLVKALADARMVVTSAETPEPMGGEGEAKQALALSETAEVVHEALIREWKRLKQWVNEDREFLFWSQRLRIAREEWERTGHDAGALLRGLPLSEAKRWLDERSEDFSETERTFIQTSLDLQAKEALQTHRRIQFSFIGLIMALLLIGYVAYRAFEESKHANLERDAAISRELAAQAREHIPIDPELSVRLAMAAMKMSPTDEAELTLRKAIAKSHIRRVLEGHDDEVWDVVFSPNGSIVVSVSDDGMARLWDPHSGEEIGRLEHQGAVNGVKFSSDGKFVVTHGTDALARVWDVATFQLISELQGHKRSVVDADFSPDNRYLITASRDHTALIWETQSGQILQQLTKHTHEVSSSSFSPDGSYALTASLDHTAKLWNPLDGQLIQDFKGHTGPIWSAQFHADGQTILTASEDGTARLWNVHSGKASKVLVGHLKGVNKANFSPDDRYIVTASSDNTARVWRTESGTLLAILMGHSGLVYEAEFSPKGNWVVTASFDGTARLWDRYTGTLVANYLGHLGSVTSATFSPKEEWVVTGGRDNSIRLWDANPEQVQTIIEPTPPGPITWAFFGGNGDRLIVGSGSNVQVWDLLPKGLKVELSGHTDLITSACLFSDGDRIVTASLDGTIRLWGGHSGEPLGKWLGEQGAIYGASCSPDERLLLTVGQDKTAKLWNIETMNPERILRGHQDSVLRGRFSSNGKLIATSSADGSIRLWKSETGKPVVKLTGHKGWVNDIVFSPNDQFLISAGKDKTARLWDTGSKENLGIFRGHSGPVLSVGFSPNGNWVVTASEDKTVKVWEVESGKLMQTFEGYAESVNSVSFGPEGKTILTGSSDGLIRIHEFNIYQSSDALLQEAKKHVTKELSPEERKKYIKTR